MAFNAYLVYQERRIPLDKIFKSALAAAGGAVSYLFGGWSGVLGVLLVFVVLDYLSGMAAAAVEGKLASSTGMIGITRKIGIFVLVAIGHLVDGLLGEGHLIRDAAIWFYSANELLSIIENGGRIGVPIPPAIRQAIEVLQGKGTGKGV